MKQGMKSVKLIIGALLILIAIYLFATNTTPAVKYAGAGVLAVLGIALIYKSLQKK